MMFKRSGIKYSHRILVVGALFSAFIAALWFSMPARQIHAQSSVDESIFNEFEAWASSTNKAETALGESLAARRLATLQKLAEQDPEAVIRHSLSPDAYQALPANVQKHVETPMSFRGDLLVFMVDEIDRESGGITAGRVERFVRQGDKIYKAAVYGRRSKMTTKHDIPMHGVLVGNVFVIDEEPVERLADGVSAIVGGEVRTFAGPGDLDTFVGRQLRHEAEIGPEAGGVGTESSWTEGEKRVLLIRVDFTDSPGDPVDAIGQTFTQASGAAVMANHVGPFYEKNSYGKTSLVSTVTSVIRLPKTRAFYSTGSNYVQMLTDARNAARNAGYETNEFHFDLVAFRYTSALPWAGIGGVGSKGALLNGSFSLGTIAHELGHGFGLWHGNAWRTYDGSVIGPGSHIEYGDGFDTMGLGASLGPGAHFNTHYKRRLDWLSDDDIHNVTAGGTYRIAAHDNAAANGKRAIKIRKNASRNYWIEFRQAMAGNQGLMNGATVRWDYSSAGYRETQLLDMKPSTPGNVTDAPLLIGQTFADTEDGISITIVGKGNTSPESLDVSISFGSTPTPTPTPSPTATPSPTPFPTPTATPTPTPSPTPVPTPTATPAPTPSPTPPGGPRRSRFDFDGDGKADISVRRPGNNVWYLLRSQAGYTGMEFGVNSDRLAPADFDGDGKTDVAVFRPATGTWFRYFSSTNSFDVQQWGGPADLPVPADHDGDGKADLALFRPTNSTWYIKLSGSGAIVTRQFGALGDKPQIGDFDGDGRADLAVYRPSARMWYFHSTTAGFTGISWGASGDLSVAADYDGDGRTDAAVFRPSNGMWYIAGSSAGFFTQAWGASGDLPVPADYDGDGKADPAVFRASNSTWYLFTSGAGIGIHNFGTQNDRPIPAAFAY